MGDMRDMEQRIRRHAGMARLWKYVNALGCRFGIKGEQAGFKRKKTHANHAPSLRFLCRITANVATPLSLGEVPYGVRRFIPITGGTVAGSELCGEVLAGGGDWQTQRDDGTLDIRAQYVIQTGDGALIEVESRGYRHGPAEVMARLIRGETVEPHEYYFRTAMTFRTAAPAWEKLNSLLAIGKATRLPNAAVLDVYLVE